MGKLYLLPVGHDLTLRAQRVLGEAALIVGRREWIAEFAGVPSLYVDGSPSGEDLEAVRGALQKGDVVWLVDARPEIEVYTLVRELVAQGIAVSPLPTGDSLTAILAASGLPLDRFTFLGSLTAADGRVWERLAKEPGTIVCVSRAADLAKVVADAGAVLGKREIALWDGKELWRGTTDAHIPRPTGERCLLIVRGASQLARWPEDRVRREARAALAAGTSPRDAARAIATRSGWPRREVYRIVLEEV